jgi:hypothetical protein
MQKVKWATIVVNALCKFQILFLAETSKFDDIDYDDRKASA